MELPSVSDDESASTWGFREGSHLAPGYLAWYLLSVGKRFEMWAAWSLERLTPVCVKFPRRDAYTDSAINALHREYTATSACDHPAIARVFDRQLDGPLPHLVLEFIEGEPLGEYLDREGPMDDEAVIYTGLQLLAALRHLHQRGYVHYDLKPANIMVRDDRPIVVDFDLALPIDSQRSRTKPRGTHGYMSPEQIRCAPASPSMDLFALGAVMYKAATGISPFRSATTSTGNPSVLEQPRRYVQIEGGRRHVTDAAPDLAPSVAEAIEALLIVDSRRRPATAEAAITLLNDAWAEHGEPLWPANVTAALDLSPRRPLSTRSIPQTQLVTGDGVALEWCRSWSPTERSRTVVVVEEQLEHSPPVAELCKELSPAPAATVVPVDPGEAGFDALARLATRLTEENTKTVVAIGGVDTLDLARLACLLAATQDQPTENKLTLTLRNPGPGGLLRVSDVDGRGAELIAIPTALVTGVEASPVAGFIHDGTRRLVLSPALQPTVALLDPSMTAALSELEVEQGLLEGLFRYLGPMLAGPSSVPTADDQALVEAAALVDLLVVHRSSVLSSNQRLEASIRGANGRRGFALDGRDPFANKLWCLATALTDLAPVSGVDAHVALLPTFVQRIVAGDTRFGDADQLRRVGDRLHAESVDAVDAFGAGAFLVAILGAPATVGTPSVDPAELAAHANRVWGDTQPMLGMFTEAELTDFYSEAF